MSIPELIDILEDAGVSKDCYRIVEEPDFSKKQIKTFEEKYSLLTEKFLELDNEDLFMNYAIHNDDRLAWLDAIDNVKFYR